MEESVWHSVARHLPPRELCRCMRVSRGWFGIWVVDRAWRQQRERICSVWQGMAAVFEGKAGREAGSHRKRARRDGHIVIPRRGTWFVFKRWLGYDEVEWFSRTLSEPKLAPLRAVMFATHLVVCCGWVVQEVKEDYSLDGDCQPRARVYITFRNGVVVKFSCSTAPSFLDRTAKLPNGKWCTQSEVYSQSWIRAPWEHFVRDNQQPNKCWTVLQPAFLEAIKG